MNKDERDAKTCEYAQELTEIVLRFVQALRAHALIVALTAETHIHSLIETRSDDHEATLEAVHMAVSVEVVQNMAEGLELIVDRGYKLILPQAVNATLENARTHVGSALVKEAMGEGALEGEDEENEEKDEANVIVRFLQHGGDA